MTMSFNIIRLIACEKHNSQVIPSSPRDELQRLRLSGLYELLVVLRILLTLNFQTGWIHQEEFSNSLEVVAGDHFDLQVFKSNALNSSFPTRSMTLMQCSIYLPYFFGYFHTTYKDETGKEMIPNSKLLVLLPRLFYVAMSFLVDFLMVKFCERHNQDHRIRLVTLASSQVLLIFATRTHASSLNLLLFALLLYLVSESLQRMAEYTPILDKYHRTKDPVERVAFLREKRRYGYSTIEKLHWITLIVVIGFFNDPEFLLSYAVVPLFFYMNRGISNRHVGIKHFHARCFTFLFYFLVFSIPFVIIDSFYYGRLTSIDDFMSEEIFNADKFVVTPVNYFVDKTTSFLRNWKDNPWIIFNFFIMFNVLGVIGVISFAKDIYDTVFSAWRDKPKLDSEWTFLNACLFVPLLLLIKYRSLFDLVPLVFPLVYMHGHKIPLISRFNSKIGFSWFFLNLISVVYFGYLSQGGIVSSLLDLYSQLVPIRYNTTQVDIVFSQMTAIPPMFILAIPSKWKTLVTAPTALTEVEFGLPSNLYKTVLKLEMSSKIRVFHTGLSPLPKSHLERDLSRIITHRTPLSSSSSSPDHQQDVGKNSLDKVNFLLIPSSEAKDIEGQFHNLKVTYIKTYWNHLWFSLPFWNYNEQDQGQKRPAILDLGLQLYRIERVEYWKDKISITNQTWRDEKFQETFHFTDIFSDLFSCALHSALMLFTMILFFMSYLVFLT